MKRNCLTVLFLTSFMLLLSLGVFAAGPGNVQIRFNGGAPDDTVYTGETNTMEFIINNANPVKGMSLGFEFTSVVPGFSWQSGYGNRPIAPPQYVQEYNTAVGTFDLGGLLFTATSLPDSFLLGGASLTTPLPANASPTKLYDVKLIMPADPGIYPGGFCVNNIFFPPAGTWKFDEGGAGGAYPPTFQGNPNASSSNPDAPPVCFQLQKRQCRNPIFTSTPPAAVSRNHCLAYTFDFNATEGGNQPPADPVTFTTSAGTINPSTGELSVPGKSDCGTTDVVVTAHNACQGFVDYPFTITWTNSNPNITNCPASGTQKVGMGNNYTYQFTWVEPDPCDGSVWSATQCGGPDATGRFGVSGTGLFHFNTLNPDDGDSTFCFCVRVTDPCGGFSECCFDLKVLKAQPFIIQIEKTHMSIQGHYEYVSITQQAGSESMGGFDFLVNYDYTGLSFFSAQLGSGVVACQWEYFTYRYWPYWCWWWHYPGWLRLVALADQNNGAHHPICYKFAPGTELVILKFLVTNDRTFQCQYIPIRFAWMDCGDNAISNIGGDTLWISDQVFDFENTNPLTDPLYNITNEDCATPFHFGGYCDPACLIGMKTRPISFIYFWNGGVDIACADSIDARGDLNLNGVANEIADAVLYTNYFLHGMSAFPVLGREGAIAASDVNNDGRTLTVGDLVFLLRIVVGDALPFPKLAPFANNASVNVVNGAVSTEASTEIGAVYATFAVNGAYNVVNRSNMEVVSAENNGELKVLVYSGVSNMTNRIAAGNNELFAVNGNVELKSVEVADYNGNLLNTRINKTALPTAFALSQNMPNPFNPTTKIGLDLPTASDWTLNIYNVAGQLVKSFNGHGVGNVTVEWDASHVSSGIYFYKATAGSFTDTKKMVLMK